MRALSITEDHQLELVDLPEPVTAPGEVLVDVIAAGVNRADLAQVAGMYPPPPDASELPGLEVSGHRRDTGEAVVALLAGGGYAEVVAVPEGQLLPVPEGMDWSTPPAWSRCARPWSQTSCSRPDSSRARPC